MIRLFTDIKHYQQSSRKELIGLLRPFIDKKSRSVQENKATYGISQEEYSILDNPEGCDIAVLPMSWNYYYDKKITKAAWAFIDSAVKANKKVISWTGGDFGITPPYHESVYVFRTSGYDNNFPRNHRVLPVFITDPVKFYFNNDPEGILKSPANGGTIGFCGLANPSMAKHLKEWITIAYRNAKFALKISHRDPQELRSSTALRCKIIDKLEQDKQLKTNFICRDKYRGGSTTEAERKDTSIEYFDNMVNSDFILCVRGNGNFSVRFYECLAMGRIPLLINTHSPLPDIRPLNWDDYMVTVNVNDLKSVHEKISKFLQNRDIMQQRVINRELFFNYLTNAHFWEKNITEINNTISS